MVSKKLQDKFYAALESLRDGKNDYILEALAAGAKATFEGLFTGKVSEDGTYIPSKDEVPRSASIGPDSCPRVLTKEDIQMLTHDPDTENEEDPEELNFDDNVAKRFPTYPGQFSEEEDPFYSMVAEAVTKLGNAISEMKTSDNASLLEAIEEGYRTCFEGVQYGYEWKFHNPGEEDVVSPFGTTDYSDHYDSGDRKSYAKSLASKVKRFGMEAPRFGKPMTKTYSDGSTVTLTPMKQEWDSSYTRYGIPKAIREKADRLIAANGWDIHLDTSGTQRDYNTDQMHGGIPVGYTGEISDPSVVDDISYALAPLGFRHETKSEEAHYGFTGHGPIDTETFTVDVWKYVGKPQKWESSYDGDGSECDAGIERVQADAELKNL